MSWPTIPPIYPASFMVQISIPISSGAAARWSTLVKGGTLLSAVNLPTWLTRTRGGPGSPNAALTNAQQCTEIAMRLMAIIIENPSAGFATDLILAMTNKVIRPANTLYQTSPAMDGPRSTFAISGGAAFNAFALCLCSNSQIWDAGTV